MKLMKEKAEQLLQRCEVVVITSVNEEGYPRPVPMSKIKSEGYSVVWMATGNDSLKTKDFRLNPKAGLCYSENGNSVALTGEVEVITDAEIKKELWQEWFIAHFPLGIMSCSNSKDKRLRSGSMGYLFTNSQIQIRNSSFRR